MFNTKTVQLELLPQVLQVLQAATLKRKKWAFSEHSHIKQALLYFCRQANQGQPSTPSVYML